MDRDNELNAYLDRRHKEEQEADRIEYISSLIAHDFEWLEFPDEILVFRYLFEKKELWYTILDNKIVEIETLKTDEGFLIQAFETTCESIKHNYFINRYFEAKEVYNDLIKNKNVLGTFVKVPYTNFIFVQKDYTV